jgi:hypothetical protein
MRDGLGKKPSRGFSIRRRCRSSRGRRHAAPTYRAVPGPGTVRSLVRGLLSSCRRRRRRRCRVARDPRADHQHPHHQHQHLRWCRRPPRPGQPLPLPLPLPPHALLLHALPSSSIHFRRRRSPALFFVEGVGGRGRERETGGHSPLQHGGQVLVGCVCPFSLDGTFFRPYNTQVQ